MNSIGEKIGVTQRKIIFVHQSKAGGTTLVQSLRETYGRANVYHDSDNSNLVGMALWRRKLNLMIQPYRNYEDRAKYEVIHGHIYVSKYRRVFPSAFNITFYRHPVQRVISTYYYWLRTPQLAAINLVCRWLHEERPSIVEFAARVNGPPKYFGKFLVPKRFDYYCKLFAPERFDFVGITERMDDSMRLLKFHIPELKIDVQPQRANPQKSVEERYQLTDYEQRELSAILERRIGVYNVALNRFSLEWASYLSTSSNVDDLNQRVHHELYNKVAPLGR